MVDIHCHLLYSLDDGPDSIEESLKMAEMAIADGITHVAATPHANDLFTFHPDLVRERQSEIQSRLGNRLTLGTGCDFHLSFQNLQDARLHPAKYTLNQKNYLLVEFADYSIPPSMDEALHQLQLSGLIPIITHPERNPLIGHQPARLDRWIHQGCFVQVTAQSFLGRFGSYARRWAENWLDEGRIHFVATDAHNVTSRPLVLGPAFKAVANRQGQEVARALFQDNPLAAFQGRPLPYIPDTSKQPQRPPRRRKRFFFF